MTRWQDFLQLRPETLDLYSGRYEPNVFGNSYSLLIPYPEITALVASAAELMLPAALVIGFATRLSALGIFIMTLIIFTTYQTSGVGADLWQTETLPWAAMALMLIAFGPGRLCFDNLIARNLRRS